MFEEYAENARSMWEVLPYTSPHLSAPAIKAQIEYERCKNDLLYFIDKYVHVTNDKQEQPMKIIECGEYLTRSGATAIVNTICSIGDYPVRGHVESDTGRKMYSWQGDGSVFGGWGEPLYDLISKVEAPFEITETGWYKTRDGRRVHIVRIEEDYGYYPCQGEWNGHGHTIGWCRDGRWEYDETAHDSRDIVAKAEAPKAEAPKAEAPKAETVVEHTYPIGSKVVVYDKYRFAIPLTAIVRDHSLTNDGVKVELTQSNSAPHPVGSNVWVHEAQLRLNS